MLLKNTFSNVINDYEYARPGYPIELYEKICAFSGLSEGAYILEVGAGTGQATDLFLKDCYKLDLVEVSEEQVRFLKDKYKKNQNISVNRAYFEDFQSNMQYDLIYSATAFHWVKSEIGYPKAWDMLKDGGTMAVFWHMSSVTYYSTGLFQGLNELKKKYLPDETLGFDEEGIRQVIRKRVAQIKTGGYFGDPEIVEYRWADHYDADRYSALVNTYSSTQLLDATTRERYLYEIKAYIDHNGGKVELPQSVILFLTKKYV